MEEKEIKMVQKRIICPRCKGTGTWVSSRTGVRAATVSEPLTNSSRVCPRCKGRKTVIVRITEEQDRKEKVAKAKAKAKVDTENKKAKARIDAKAKADKEAIDSN